MISYKDIRFLESTVNLREISFRNSGRELSTERANQIAVCLEQGRFLFEAAQNVGWEIKPLLVYYGMVGFAKAISIARRFLKLESLPRRHGLTLSAHTLIEQSRVKIEKEGTIHGLNDACSALEAIILHNLDSSTSRLRKPTSPSRDFEGEEITLKEILARIPGLEYLYRKTFGEESKVKKCSHFICNEDDEGVIEFEIHDFLPFTDLKSLELSVTDLRIRFPFLNQWRLRYAAPGSTLQFANLVIETADEFSALEFRSGAFYLDILTTTKSGIVEQTPRLQFDEEALPNFCQPVRGNLTPDIPTTYLIEEYNGRFLSEVSLFYLGMFLLGSLVRYKPDIWANAVARRSHPQQPLDDHALALIQEFIDLSLKVFPEATVVAINQPFS